MLLHDAIQKIEKYISSESNTPIIVDLQNRADLEGIKAHFAVGNNSFITTSEYCNDDENPRLEELFDIVSRKNGTVFLTELSTFLKLQGEHELRSYIMKLLNLAIDNHIVILTYQCRQYMRFKDPRIIAASKTIIVDGKEDLIPKIVFVAQELPVLNEAVSYSGIQRIATAIEQSDSNCVYIRTAKSKEDYPLSLFLVVDMAKAYDLIAKLDLSITAIPEEYGTETQWKSLLVDLKTKGTIADVIADSFGNTTTLAYLIHLYNSFEENKQWRYYIALKIFGAGGNEYLTSVLDAATGYDDFIRTLYRHLLSVDHKSKAFASLYQERKKLLRSFSNNLSEISDYCKVVLSKGKYALHYLTDNSLREKKLIIELLDKYCFDYERSELEHILQIVYPDLYSYLSPYRFGNTLLNDYFRAYKFGKVINKILPEFEKLVTDQAVKREYNALLLPRASKVEKIDKTDTQLYFVDAMGVEYLSYLLAKCQEKGLLAHITVWMAELPTLTSINKEFIEPFEQAGCPVISIKELDEIKHHGKEDFDYRFAKLPIHIIRELDIIDEVLNSIQSKLISGTCKKVVIIADHGASRLAVIHETENQWEMASKGEHSGRCCPVNEIDTKPDYATEERDFWVLANYDRFKGGRKASVEVHGGATLEEVTVPIIEITSKGKHIEVFILDDYKHITVSYRKKAMIRLFIGDKQENVNIRIEGNYYTAEPVEECIYQVELPDIRKAKIYSCDVFAGNDVLASGLSFEVIKESLTEKNLI